MMVVWGGNMDIMDLPVYCTVQYRRSGRGIRPWHAAKGVHPHCTSLLSLAMVAPLVRLAFHACNNAYSMHLHVRTCTDMPCSVVFTAYFQVEGLSMESSMRCGQPFARHIRLCLYRCFGARGPVADNAVASAWLRFVSRISVHLSRDVAG